MGVEEWTESTHCHETGLCPGARPSSPCRRLCPAHLFGGWRAQVRQAPLESGARWKPSARWPQLRSAALQERMPKRERPELGPGRGEGGKGPEPALGGGGHGSAYLPPAGQHPRKGSPFEGPAELTKRKGGEAAAPGSTQEISAFMDKGLRGVPALRDWG